LNHLFDDHKVRAPIGETKSASLKKVYKLLENKATSRPATRPDRSIAQMFGLDPQNPKEQMVANTFIKRFDRQHFQRMLVEFAVDSNLPFAIVENPKLRSIFEYLSPSVAVQDAHISATEL
jgi:hypothetical protein